MVCIYCEGPTKVVNSRHQRRTNDIWRRRHCLDCGAIFTTYEAAALETGIVVQYGPQDMPPFARDHLFIDIYEACKHQGDAIAIATALTQTIISKLVRETTNGSLPRTAVIAACREVLGRFDTAAEAVYSAYHK